MTQMKLGWPWMKLMSVMPVRSCFLICLGQHSWPRKRTKRTQHKNPYINQHIPICIIFGNSHKTLYVENQPRKKGKKKENEASFNHGERQSTRFIQQAIFSSRFTEDFWILIRSKILSNKAMYGRDVSSLTKFFYAMLLFQI